MHVGFRTSRGRGEYELVGEHDGLHASEASAWMLELDLPGLGPRATNLWVDPADSGKPRLRSFEGQWPQIGRQTAAILLLPDPVRDRSALGADPRILRGKAFFLMRLGFRTETSLDRVREAIVARPAYVEVQNAVAEDTIWFEGRFARVRAVHERASDLPSALRIAVARHASTLESGEPVGRASLAARDAVMAALGGDEAGDPLPHLERLLGLLVDPVGDPPDPTDIDDPEPKIRVRAASMRRMAAARGSSAARFSLAVRQAYDHACVLCGLQLPGGPGRVSGVDAAHILAWSTWDLDVVPNGMCLCKTHHWAFDSGVIAVVPDGSGYRAEVTDLASDLQSSTRDKLSQVEGSIDPKRLPANHSDWPSQYYLERLYADLSLEV
jgi:hypothetical protein